jgi:3-hydroxyisobutyrate dehydrogenase
MTSDHGNRPLQVAVLGTGAMGAGMARTLAREGFAVTAWNRTTERAAPLREDGIAVVADVAEAVVDAAIVVTMLFDVDAVETVLREALPAMADGAVVLQCSTVGAPGARRIGTLVRDFPLAYVDAPVLGTKGPANDGNLTVLASGDADAIERAVPVLDALGTKTVVVGEEPGAASALKLACNSWVASVTAATGQALALARAGGVPPDLFLAAIEGTPVDTPYAQLKGKAMLAGAYDAQFRLDGLRKDLDLMAAQADGTDTALLTALRATYAAASDLGHGDDDIAAVAEAFGGGS